MSRKKDFDSRLGTDTTAEVPKARTKTITSELPQPADRAQLVALTGTGSGRRYQIKDEVLIGRHPAATVWIPDEGVSRRHAKIVKGESGEFTIEDLGSRNGTLVNGIAVKKQPLSFGDKIAVGAGTILVFTFADPLEEQMLQLQKMEAIGRLAAGVAHEFNNLLEVVLNNLSLVIERPDQLDEEEHGSCLIEARQAAVRGAELTRQMLDFSRISSIEMTLTDITSLVEEVSQLVGRTCGPNIHVQVAVDPDLYVNGDRLQLYQVLMNLCINAVDAMSRKGKVMIIARSVELSRAQLDAMPNLQPGTHVELLIKDSGVGMDPETLQKAFDPFFTTKETGEGTGLGLSMVLGLVRNHRGDLSIETQSRKGTTVGVYLPRAGRPGRTTAEVTADKEPPEITGTVLVVDDDDLVARGLSRTLRAYGFEVMVASDGRSAIQAYEQHRGKIDLVLLDLLMPGIGGQETFSILKRIDPDVCVLISSGNIEEDASQRLLAAGALGFLKKPYQPEELIRAISTALRSREAAGQREFKKTPMH